MSSLTTPFIAFSFIRIFSVYLEEIYTIDFNTQFQQLSCCIHVSRIRELLKSIRSSGLTSKQDLIVPILEIKKLTD